MEYLAPMTSQESFMSANAGFVSGFIFILLVVWSIIWKGIALWKAARNGQKVWFVALLLLNTVGLLELIYIFAVSRNREKIATKASL